MVPQGLPLAKARDLPAPRPVPEHCRQPALPQRGHRHSHLTLTGSAKLCIDAGSCGGRDHAYLCHTCQHCATNQRAGQSRDPVATNAVCRALFSAARATKSLSHAGLCGNEASRAFQGAQAECLVSSLDDILAPLSGPCQANSCRRVEFQASGTRRNASWRVTLSSETSVMLFRPANPRPTRPRSRWNRHTNRQS